MTKKQLHQTYAIAVPSKRILGAALSLLLFFLLLMSVIRLGEKYFAVRNRNKQLAAEAAALQQKEATLATTNAYLSSPEGTEQALRERYNYIKPGEGMIIISPQAPLAGSEMHQTAVERWWDELLHGLGIRKD